VKLVLQIFVLFVVNVGERGAEGSYFEPKDLPNEQNFVPRMYNLLYSHCGSGKYPDPTYEMDLFFLTTIFARV